MSPKTVPRSFPSGFLKTTPYHPNSSSPANASAIAMRHHLSLTIIATNRINLHLHRVRSHRPRLLSVDATEGPMAEEACKGTKSGDESSALKGEKKEEEVVLPPPPEKPLPGDCCGSGCVRCVWDVYYEELEDYNKLVSEIKSKGDSSSKQ